MNCYFCQIPISDNNPPSFVTYFDAYCKKCDAYHHYANNILTSIQMGMRLENKFVCYLIQNIAEQRANILIDGKYINIPWEIASTITPNNIQKRLKTYLVFS